MYLIFCYSYFHVNTISQPLTSEVQVDLLRYPATPSSRYVNYTCIVVHCYSFQDNLQFDIFLYTLIPFLLHPLFLYIYIDSHLISSFNSSRFQNSFPPLLLFFFYFSNNSFSRQFHFPYNRLCFDCSSNRELFGGS
jgi:hypothetical protein